MIQSLFNEARHANAIDPAIDYVVLRGEGAEAVVELYFEIDDHKIKTARFLSSGNTVSIAVCEYVCRLLEKQAVDKIAMLKAEHLCAALELPAIHAHNVYLVVKALSSFAQKI